MARIISPIGFTWNGVELTPAFGVDFTKEKLGRTHHMKLDAKSLRAGP
jgi:selenium-binding protein 1